MVAAGDVEDFHAPGLGVVEEVQRAGRQGGAVGGYPAVPEGVVEEVLALAEQGAPIAVAAEDGVVEVADDRRWPGAGLAFGQGLVQAQLGQVEALVVEGAVFGGRLPPGDGGGQQVGRGGVGFRSVGQCQLEGRGEDEQGGSDCRSWIGHG